jgi:mono/diheme cytochrome c family protein
MQKPSRDGAASRLIDDRGAPGRSGARSSWGIAILLVFVFTDRAAGETVEWLPGQSLVEGQQAFASGGCARCHPVLGTGTGGAGPDLARSATSRDMAQTAAALWNHAPIQGQVERDAGSAPATLTPDDAGQIVGYLFQLGFRDRPGDVERGRLRFQERSCARCHQLRGQGGTIGPRLDEIAPWVTALFLAEAVWTHGARMADKMAALDIQRPQLTTDDVDDLLAFLRGSREPVASLEQVAAQTGRPGPGKGVFSRKGCVQCHAIRGTGGGIGPDLGVRRPGWRLAAVVAALWNHGPAMWAMMESRGTPVPRLTEREMADVVAYLCFVQYANIEGDATRGAALFREKSCALCHPTAAGSAGSGGPDLVGAAIARSPLRWTAAMWNHAPAVEAQLRARGLPWPHFEGDEMRDLVAFLRASGGAR